MVTPGQVFRNTGTIFRPEDFLMECEENIADQYEHAMAQSYWNAAVLLVKVLIAGAAVGLLAMVAYQNWGDEAFRWVIYRGLGGIALVAALYCGCLWYVRREVKIEYARRAMLP